MEKKISAAFVDLSIDFLDRHSIYSLSAVLKQNAVDTHYLNGTNPAKLINQLEALRPDLVMYSAVGVEIPKFIRFDSLLKTRLGVKSIIGGSGPTLDPGQLKNSTIDAICVGEGETAIIDYVAGGFKHGKNIIGPGQAVPRSLYPFVELDSLPFSDRELVYRHDDLKRNMPSKQFLAGRGCPYLCTYCCNGSYQKILAGCGKYLRQKSVDYLISEIKAVKSRYPLKHVVFQDDIFILNRKWLELFSGRFAGEIGLTFSCNVRANLVDEDIVRILKAGNCVSVTYSIESGDDYLRKEVLGRNITREQILSTGVLFRKYRINRRTGNMLGLPGETYEQMLKTLELNIEAKPTFGHTTTFTPFHGLPLTDYALSIGALSRDAMNNIPRSLFNKTILNYSGRDRERIFRLMRLFPIFVKWPVLYREPILKKLLFSLPGPLLSVLHHALFTYLSSRIFQVKVPWSVKFRILCRYLKSYV